jgi:hypothetical protein
MAKAKNSARRKRKYGAEQQNRTAKNREARKARHARRIERMRARTQALVGREATCLEPVKSGEGVRLVLFRGVVDRVIFNGADDYPRDAERNSGSYVVLRRGNSFGAEERKVSRSRIKVLR